MNTTAVLFPGQGSQYSGMGKKLYDKYPEVRLLYEEAAQIIGFDVAKLSFEGTLEELTKTENAQVALFMAEISAFRIFEMSTGIMPAYAAGHSVGEFAALCCADVLSFPDALQLVRERGLLMAKSAKADEGLMCAVTGLGYQEVEEACAEIAGQSGWVGISNYNSPRQTVISGEKSAVQLVQERLAAQEAQITFLKTGAPFHSPLMQKAAEAFADKVANCRYHDFRFPVISNVNGLPYSSVSEVGALLASQIVKPVQWVNTMQYLQRKGVRLFVELGPKSVLRNLALENCPETVAYSLDKEADTASLLAYISSASQESRKNHNGLEFITRCIRAAICTRNRNWDEQEYQEGVVKPYRGVLQLHDELTGTGEHPTLEHMNLAADMLDSVFHTKKVPVEEQQERWAEILEESQTRELFHERIAEGNV